MNKQYDNFLKIINTSLTGNMSNLVEPDFGSLGELAFCQDIAPIFLEGAIKYPEFATAPISIKARLIDNSTKSVIRQTQNTAQFLSIYSKLTDAGLKPIVLKGLVCRKAYGNLENHRASGDEDIFISKSNFPLCHKILTDNGYLPEDEREYSDRYLSRIAAVAYSSETAHLKIELHLSLFGTQNPVRKAMNRCFDESLKNPYKMPCDKIEIYTLQPTDHYLFLLFHYLKHFMTTGAGLRHVTDLAVFGNKYKDIIDFSGAEKKFTEFIDGSFYADTVKLMNLLGGEETASAEGLDCDRLLTDLMNGGTFGYDDRDLTYAGTFISSKTGGSRFGLFRSVFPSYDLLSPMHPELYDKPWKLPSVYCKRITGYIKNKRNPEAEKKAIEKGNKRIKLLSDYGLKKK